METQRRRRFSMSISIPSPRISRPQSFLVTPQSPPTPSRITRVIRRLSSPFRSSPNMPPLPSYTSFMDTDYVYDDDMDVSYEGLLRLAARIGDAKPKNLPHDLKANLPRGTYKTCSEAQLEKRCAICLEKYEHNDSVLGISECAHYFHASCFEKWLDVAANCPVCRCEITTSHSTSGPCASSPVDSIGRSAAGDHLPIPASIRARDYDMPYNHVG